MKTICEFLACDHRRCDELFAQIETAIARKDWPDTDAAFFQFRRLLISHIAIEERFLFPAFKEAVQHAAGPLAMLRLEHQHLSGLLDRMQQALLRREANDFMLHIESYMLLNQEHGMKEEEILYKLLDRVMAGRANALVNAMCAARAAYDDDAVPNA